MIDLAQNHNRGAIQLRDIARRQDVSQKYLEQIIKPLKKAGFIESIRGARGGYLLPRSPKEIMVGDVVSLLEGGAKICACTEDPLSCGRTDICLTRSLWMEAAEAMFGKLCETSLHDLLQNEKGRAGKRRGR
jgi:Rrf2 family protein